MSELVLFEDHGFVGLLPLTFWRTVFELRVGRQILLDRTAQRVGRAVAGVWTRDWIAKVAAQRCGAPANRPLKPGSFLVNGRWLFNEPIAVPKPPHVGLIDGQIAYIVCDETLAGRLTPEDLLARDRAESVLRGLPRSPAPGRLIRYPWDVLVSLLTLLEEDWHEGDAAIDSEVDRKVIIAGREHVHVGERTQIHPTAVIDAGPGPVFISHDVQVGAYAVLEGPLYLGPGTRVQPHAWLHAGNAIGPICKLGGEVAGCAVQGYTNKSHHGYLGHSYVGSWVNFGAGTSNSDLKNSYGRVKVPINGTEVDSGEMFLGAVIGDHVKTAINSSIPTGAVLGFAACAATSRLLPKWVPSFAWVTDDGVTAGNPDRLLDTAARVTARRNIDLTDDEVELFLDLATRVKSYETRRP
jgi:UDP-N-acetylglucosamine diphosphorylase/glucosamine-1-phosphate N-acetyltransferase